MKSLRGQIALLLCAALVSPGSAIAQPATPTSSEDAKKAANEEAATRYARGIELYKEENYKAALVEFKKAYELTNSYKVLYNIGQVCYQLQDYVCAVTSFDEYLARGGTEISEARRTEVNGELKKLRPRIAEVTIRTNVDGVDITIDDIPRGKTPLKPVFLSAGSHRLSAIKEGKVPITQQFEVAGADKPVIKIDLVDLTGKQVIVKERVGDTSKWTTLSYIGLGVGGALLIGGGVTGAMALSSASDLKNQRYVGEPTDEAKSLQTRVKTLRLTSDILIAASVVTLGTTLALTLTRKTETPATTALTKPNIAVGIGLGSVSLQGEF